MYITILVATNLVTAAAFTVLGMWLTMIALNLEFVRKKLTEETRMPPAKKRRFGRTDVIIAIVIIGFIATGWNQISIGKTSTRADKSSIAASKDATAASEDATMAVAGLRSVVKCLTSYSNDLADALDRRNADNAALQEADAKRDTTLLRLAATGFTSQPLLQQLAADTQAKQAAKEAVAAGRREKGYPEAPRDVCAS